MARTVKISEIKIESVTGSQLTICGNETLISKYDFRLEGGLNQFGNLVVYADCKSCKQRYAHAYTSFTFWVSSWQIQDGKYSIDQRGKSPELKTHYYEYHKTRRNGIGEKGKALVSIPCSKWEKQGSELQNSETDDCVVRSFSDALELPYDLIHAKFKELGREDRNGTSHLTTLCFVKNVNNGHYPEFPKFKIEKIDLGIWDRENQKWKYPTINNVIPSLSKEFNYTISIPRHMFSVVGGIIRDWRKSGGKTRVQQYFKITKLD